MEIAIIFFWTSQVWSYLVSSFLTDKIARLCLSNMRVALNAEPFLFIDGEPINQGAYAIGFT